MVPVTPEKVSPGANGDPANLLGVPASNGDGEERGVTPSPPLDGDRGGTSSTIFQAPLVPPQLERRKSVRDLVTDFSSCESSVSSGEESTLGDWGETVTKRKKKKRKASTSPILQNDLKNGNVRASKTLSQNDPLSKRN